MNKTEAYVHRRCNKLEFPVYYNNRITLCTRFYLDLYKCGKSPLQQRTLHSRLRFILSQSPGFQYGFIFSEEPMIRAGMCLQCSQDPHWFLTVQTVWLQHDLWPEPAWAVQLVQLHILWLAVLCPSLQPLVLWFWSVFCSIHSLAAPIHKNGVKSNGMV